MRFAFLMPVLLLCLSGVVRAQDDRQDAEGLIEASAALETGDWLWEDDPGPDWGDIRISVSIALQRAYVWRGDTLFAVTTVSTGAPGHETPLGTYSILQKARHHRSNLYSNSPMPFMQRLTWDGIALHAGDNPGYPASHGCIRLPHEFARALFTLTRLGVPVTIMDYPDLPVRLKFADFDADRDRMALTVTGARPSQEVMARPRQVRLDYALAVMVSDWPPRQ